jgi:hypothetical protein
MTEKRGQTIKLKYPFPSANCCEVFVPGMDDWHRVTVNEFRSWVGQRRILHLEGDIRSNTTLKSEYREYNGPVFLFGTNQKINTKDYKVGLAFPGGKDPRPTNRKR